MHVNVYACACTQAHTHTRILYDLEHDLTESNFPCRSASYKVLAGRAGVVFIYSLTLILQGAGR